ncbi:MAG: ABC transporter ATP-binding protein [Gemmatimonadota bacterium]
MFKRSSSEFFLYFARAHPGRTLLMIVLLVLAGLAEGVGIATLLPVLEIGTAEAGQRTSEISQAVVSIVRAAGLEPTITVLLALIVLAMSLKGLFRWLAMSQVGFIVARVATDLRLRLLQAIMRAEWRYFSSKPTGHFAVAISNEAHRTASAYREACTALAAFVQVGVYAGLVLLVSWRVALLAMLVGGGVVWLMRGFVQTSRRAGRTQTLLMRSLVSRLTEALPSIKSIKAMGREQYLYPLLEAEAHEFNRAQRRQVHASETLRSFREPILTVAVAIGLYGVLQFTDTPFSTVLVTVFLFYRLVGYVNQIQSHYQAMTMGESAFYSIMGHVEGAEAAGEDRSGLTIAPELTKEIRIDGVRFAYDDRIVLGDVDMVIPVGKFVALVGPSGSGKTTVADLIVGLLRPQSGRVLIDGVDLAEIDLASWRRELGYVPQELLLFHDTIRRNVTLRNDDISDEDVEAALRAAGAWDFVAAQPGGMDHVVGEMGSMLSGGQRQRIAIARALVERPRLLILDEATTALDPVTEAELCATLRQLAGQVTILAISHQAALREVADIVYRVEGGGLREILDPSPSVPTY